MASPCRPERPTLPWSGRRAARAWRDRDSRARRSLPAGRPRPRSSDRAADFIALELVGPDPGRVVPQALDQVPSGYTTTIGPLPHWEKQPEWLMRTVPAAPASRMAAFMAA